MARDALSSRRMDLQSEYETSFADAWNALRNGGSVISELSPELVWRLVDGRPQCGWYSTLPSIAGKWMPAAEDAQTVPISCTLAGWRIIENPPSVGPSLVTRFNVPLSLIELKMILSELEQVHGEPELNDLEDRLRPYESEMVARCNGRAPRMSMEPAQ